PTPPAYQPARGERREVPPELAPGPLAGTPELLQRLPGVTARPGAPLALALHETAGDERELGLGTDEPSQSPLRDDRVLMLAGNVLDRSRPAADPPSGLADQGLCHLARVPRPLRADAHAVQAVARRPAPQLGGLPVEAFEVLPREFLDGYLVSDPAWLGSRLLDPREQCRVTAARKPLDALALPGGPLRAQLRQ